MSWSPLLYELAAAERHRSLLERTATERHTRSLPGPPGLDWRRVTGRALIAIGIRLGGTIPVPSDASPLTSPSSAT